MLRNYIYLFSLSTVQDGIYALGNTICAPPRLSEVPPNVAFETVPLNVRLNWRWPSQERSSSASSFNTSPPGDQWCGVLGFQLSVRPAGSVSSFSTLADLPRSKPLLWGLLCPPVYLLCPAFPFIPACSGQPYTGHSFRRWMSTIDTFQCRFSFHFS